MKKQYVFADGRRGAVLRGATGKSRITIRIDDDILDWFRRSMHEQGGGSYQTAINDALRAFTRAHDRWLEDTFRRVLREELPRYSAVPSSPKPRRRKS